MKFGYVRFTVTNQLNFLLKAVRLMQPFVFLNVFDAFKDLAFIPLLFLQDLTLSLL